MFSTRFLPYSQTFVHEELSAHQRYERTCSARGACTPSVSRTRRCYEAGPLYGIHGGRRRSTAASRPELRLIHAHFGTDAVYAVPFARRHRLPLVVTFHGFDVPLLGSAERYLPMYWPYGLLGPSLFGSWRSGCARPVELTRCCASWASPPTGCACTAWGSTSVASRRGARDRATAGDRWS